MKNAFLFALLMFVSFNGYSQQDDAVLFTVDKDPVTVSEFVRVYKKNLELVQDQSQKDVDAYLKLFINYKLKLKEAYAKQLDTNPKYKRELANYKRQLVKNYVNDNKVTDALLKEAYNRSLEEVKAKHILVRLDEQATPEDTLKVYNQLLDFKRQLKAEGFNAMKKKLHNGKSIFVEDLGYFKAFKMVYSFENAAYNTPVGEISDPFKTQFGYHIVEVLDKRKSDGEREVAHIMITDKTDDSTLGNAEQRIQDIYSKLKQGESFESLAKQFSEDKSSASKGGTLRKFSKGQLSSAVFEDIAFSLTPENAISKPFKTNFGWHIVKLKKVIPVGDFNTLKPELTTKLRRDSRSKQIAENRVETLKAKYKVQNNPKALQYFVSILNDNFFKRAWSLPSTFTADKTLFKIKDKEYTYGDYGQFLINSQRKQPKKDSFTNIVNSTFQNYLAQQLTKYQEEHLEDENKDYAYVVSEYRDGLLLFDLMDNEIWNAAKKDTIALQNYFNANKTNYMFNDRIDAVVISSSDKSDIKKAAKMLKNGDSPEAIKAKLNANDNVKVLFNSGVLERGHQALPKDMAFKTGVSSIYSHNNSYVVALINTVIPKTQKTLDDARGRVVNDFQMEKEKRWLSDLAEKYKVNIDKAVLESVKQRLN